MAPGLRQLQLPSPRHRAFLPPPALTGVRPVRVAPFGRAASDALSRIRFGAVLQRGLRWVAFELPGLARRYPLRRGRVLKIAFKKNSFPEALKGQGHFTARSSMRPSGRQAIGIRTRRRWTLNDLEKANGVSFAPFATRKDVV